MKRTRIFSGLMLATLLLVGIPAMAEKLEDAPGYIDLEWIDIPDDAKEVKDINLDVVLLSIAADAEENQDEALMQALQMIKSIRVKSWSVGDEDPVAAKAMKKISKKLKDNDWKRLIYVKSDEETVTVSTKTVDGDMVGLMLVVFEVDENVAFVNVVGDLNLATLMKLVKEFDETSIEGMLEELDGVSGIEIDHN